MKLSTSLLPLMTILSLSATACVADTGSDDALGRDGTTDAENPGTDDGDGDGDDDGDGDGDGDSDGDGDDGMTTGEPPPAPAAVEMQVCVRIDECGFLPAGLGVTDCADIVGECADDLLTTEHTDWSAAVDGCLELSNCGNFANCYNAIDVCTVDDGAQPAFEGDDATCSDGIDNDGNGFTDCDDFACSDNDAVTVCAPPPAEDTDAACSDGIDNDGDGFIDCEDFDCSIANGVAVCPA